MKGIVEERAIELGHYIIESKTTVRSESSALRTGKACSGG